MTAATSIDLNSDLGEDPQELDRDAALMRFISSANIACGGHAGDDDTMRAMLAASREAEIRAGAHPSYPDRENFGRRSMDIEAEALIASIEAQIRRLADHAEAMGVALHHVKPHGALYNDLAADADLAKAVSDALAREFPALVQVGLAHGAFHEHGKSRGYPVLAEGFIDRGYTPERRLVPRGKPGAVLETDAQRTAQALTIAGEGYAESPAGGRVRIDAQSLCIHSDSPGALATAEAVAGALEKAGIAIAAP